MSPFKMQSLFVAFFFHLTSKAITAFCYIYIFTLHYMTREAMTRCNLVECVGDWYIHFFSSFSWIFEVHSNINARQSLFESTIKLMNLSKQKLRSRLYIGVCIVAQSGINFYFSWRSNQIKRFNHRHNTKAILHPNTSTQKAAGFKNDINWNM